MPGYSHTTDIMKLSDQRIRQLSNALKRINVNHKKGMERDK